MLRRDFLKQEFLAHKISYLVLLLELIAFVTLFMAAWPNRFLQRLLILLLVFFYVLWGMITHFKSDHLTKNILFEYLAVALIAGAILFLVTL